MKTWVRRCQTCRKTFNVVLLDELYWLGQCDCGEVFISTSDIDRKGKKGSLRLVVDNSPMRS